jgi:hypothetical protein
MFRFLSMRNVDFAAAITAQIEGTEWQMRAHRKVIKRNVNNVTIVEAAEAELRALETRLSVLKSNLKNLEEA